MNQLNPFIIEGYKSPEYFCDRTQETALLTEHLLNQRNVALIAKRRLGKSGLILNCFNQKDIQDNFFTFYIDIYDTKNLAELTIELGKGIFKTLKSKERKIWEGFLCILKSLRASVTFDIDGNPEWGLQIGELRTPDILLDEIFDYLEHAPKPCLVAIDEFQVIADYPEKTTEATLRKRIQHCQNAHFIYSGSKRHMMAEMFVSSGRPFYNSAALMGLEAIDRNVYYEFANHHLMQNAQSISHDAFDYLYSRFDGVTWYIQFVLNVLYSRKTLDIEFTVSDVDDAIETIIQRNAFAYRTMLYQIAPKQKELLKAIAKEGKIIGITSRAFLSKYKMTASMVQGALKFLLDRDLVTREDDAYYVYEQFFELWLSRL